MTTDGSTKVTLIVIGIFGLIAFAIIFSKVLAVTLNDRHISRRHDKPLNSTNIANIMANS